MKIRCLDCGSINEVEDVEISDGSGDEENEVVDVDKKVKDTE
jgi:hypothetical protein